MFSISTSGPAVGAGIALAGLVLGKESKTSEFRQNWIDGLRADLATLVSLSFVVNGPADTDAKLDRVQLINEVASRIRLRFACDDEQSQALLKCQSDLTTLAYHGKDFFELQEAAEALVLESQKVLKAEWKRVKRGEWRYRFVLLMAFLALILLIVQSFLPLRP